MRRTILLLPPLAALCWLQGCSDAAPRSDSSSGDSSVSPDRALAGDRSVEKTSADTLVDKKLLADLMPPLCHDLHCCIIKTCSLSNPSPCLDTCSSNLGTTWKVVYLLWWSCALCAANCSADKNCSNKSSCNSCTAECQGDIGQLGTNPACTSCIRQACAPAAAACPGMEATLAQGCS